jgi:aryl-alcohol dehydrogenase-like predicted oxidoreductase
MVPYRLALLPHHEEKNMSLDSYITLGRSGLRVSPFCLGTMTFGEDWGWGSSPAESADILAAYLDQGGNFIDTANLYTNGHAEKIIGDFFAQGQGSPARRDRCVIATKFFGNLHLGDPNGGGTGRKAIVAQCEASLRRLRTDYIDLYWMHNWDRGTPIEETMRAMDDLVRAGKVRYLGISDAPGWKVAQAQTIAQFRGWAPLIAMQVEYSLLRRTVEGELIPVAEELGLGVMPWSPLKNGWLSGKYTREESKGNGEGGVPATGRAALVGMPTQQDHVVIDAVKSVAQELGVAPAAVALAWVQGRAGVASTLIGTRSVAQLSANLAALDVRLTPAQRTMLDAVSKPVLNFPAQINSEMAPMLAFAGATVDGNATAAFPPIAASTTRY